MVEGGFEPKTIYREDSDAAPPVLDELVLIAPGGDAAALTKAAERGRIIGEGANVARRLSNRAANDITPQVLADEASEIAAANGLSIDVVDEKRAAELGMGMFLAVGQGSANKPRMIVMRSGGEGEKDALGRHLAMVGKGVCFDSGGISIKPGDRMEEMKMDKTGACTVIAAIATVARLSPGLPLLAVAPAVENMPGGGATRPGDIVKAMNGKWVDIINTDAEGRLILGDAMTYAEQLGATHIVDVATLTGAVGRAFGNIVTGAFATPDPWWDDLAAAADRAGERYWRIPLIKDYMSEMESWYGDIQNTGTPDGSLVKSGLFLEQFRTVPWAHLDIGGTGYFRKTYPYAPAGRDGRDPRDPGRARARGCRGGLTIGGPRGARARARRLRPVSIAVLTPLAVLLAALGGVWGFVADRIAARWPEHEDGSVRAIDWRTPVVVVTGVLVLGALTLRFPDPVAARDLRRLLGRAGAAAGHRPRPAAAAQRAHAARDPAGA